VRKGCERYDLVANFFPAERKLAKKNKGLYPVYYDAYQVLAPMRREVYEQIKGIENAKGL